MHETVDLMKGVGLRSGRDEGAELVGGAGEGVELQESHGELPDFKKGTQLSSRTKSMWTNG